MFSKNDNKSKLALFSFVYIFTNPLFTCKKRKILKFLVTKFEAIEVLNNFLAQILFLKPKYHQICTCFSFVYNFTNLLFTSKQKKVTNILMARIKPFEVPDKFWPQKLLKKPKTSLVFFCLLLTEFLVYR